MKYRLLRRVATGLLAGVLPVALLPAQEKAAAPPACPAPVAVIAYPYTPPVSINLLDRHGHVTPCMAKCAHSGGGLIDVQSPTADTVVITMSGSVVADGSMNFDLDQCFEVSFDCPKVKAATLTIEGRVIGLLRGAKKGCAEYGDACAHLHAYNADIVSVCVAPHSVCECESLSVNDHDGPKTIPITPGKYSLNQTFTIAARGCWLLKHPSADFAPDPALDPLWISYFDPFHGIKKDQFGFQVTLKVSPDWDASNGDKKPEAVGTPKEEKK